MKTVDTEKLFESVGFLHLQSSHFERYFCPKWDGFFSNSTTKQQALLKGWDNPIGPSLGEYCENVRIGSRV